MNALETVDHYCPYCGEPIQLLVDCSEPSQTYVEDCQVCCQPIVVTVSLFDEEVTVSLHTEDDVF